MFTRLPDRPWGRMWLVASCPWAWVKLIHVKPMQRTSLQLHRHRAELHIGLPTLTHKSSCRYVGVGRSHRMTPGIYIELAWGDDVRESDNERLSDDYGRRS